MFYILLDLYFTYCKFIFILELVQKKTLNKEAKNEKTTSEMRIIAYFELKDLKDFNNPTLAVTGSGFPMAFTTLALETW